MIIDATDLILGRLAAFAAKKALLGEKVDVINCEKAIITGNPKTTFAHFKRKFDMGAPLKGPYYPRMPDRIVRRVIRGMLPIRKTRGREAFDNVMCYIGVPEKLKDKTSEIFHDFYDSMPPRNTIAFSQLLSVISWLLIFLHSYVVALAFSINVPVEYVIGFVALASVVSLLPITFNGLGTNEASMIALFALLGVQAGQVFAFSIASSILLTYFMAFVGFLVSLSYRNKN